MLTTIDSLANAAAPPRSDWVWLLRSHGGYVAVFLLLAVAGACAIATPSATSGSWLWVAAVFIVGMPHGAYDLAAIRRSSPNRQITARRFAAYTLVLLASLGLFLALPAVAVVAFLFLAAHHFGINDSVWTRGRINLARSEHLAGLGRGLVVLFSPFAFQPAASSAPFISIARLVGQIREPQPAAIAWLAIIQVLIGFAFITFASVRIGGKRMTEEWATLAAVVALSALAPPLVAIGSYFLIIHASGHCLRALTPGRPVGDRPFANALRIHRESIPLLVPSVIIVLVGATIMPGPSPDAIAIAFLLFCIVATLPHHMLWMTSNRWLPSSAHPHPHSPRSTNPSSPT